MPRNTRTMKRCSVCLRSRRPLAAQDGRKPRRGPCCADGVQIALEVVRLVDPGLYRFRRLFQNLLIAATKELKGAQVTGHYTVLFEVIAIDKLAGNDKKRWIRETPSRIAKILSSDGQSTIIKPRLLANQIRFIARIEYRPSQQTIVDEGMTFPAATGPNLAERELAEKAEKLRQYSDKNGFYYWLAIVSWGPGSLEDGSYPMLRGRKFRTPFDRVFLIRHSSTGELIGADDITPDVAI